MNKKNLVSVQALGHVSVIKINNPPYNFITFDVLTEIQSILQALDNDPQCRSIVMASDAEAFCAGADFTSTLAQGINPAEAAEKFYALAMTFFETRKPMVAAVAGAAIGAGFGLSLVADFRVACPEATFSANFTRLGFHPGFGMSVTLPRIVGINTAELLFYTGRRIKGEEAKAIGLLTQLVEKDRVLAAAIDLATEIAVSAPLAVQDTRTNLRAGLPEQIRTANARELALQAVHMATQDFKEGVTASRERREPAFTGK